MYRRTIRANYDSMLDIMILSKKLDGFIDLYRHDPSLSIEVLFEEYLNFVMYVLGERKFLFSDSGYLKSILVDWMMSKSVLAGQKLYQNYILDVISAAAKELHLAEMRGKPATVIKYTVVGTPKVIKLGTEITECNEGLVREFYRRLDLLQYRIPTRFNCEENAKIAAYIDLSLRAVARGDGKEFLVVGI